LEVPTVASGDAGFTRQPPKNQESPLALLVVVRSGRERGARGDACARGSAIPGRLATGGARLHGASDPFFQTIDVLARDDEDRHG
jgi:hypothetical protein